MNSTFWYLFHEVEQAKHFNKPKQMTNIAHLKFKPIYISSKLTKCLKKKKLNIIVIHKIKLLDFTELHQDNLSSLCKIILQSIKHN